MPRADVVAVVAVAPARYATFVRDIRATGRLAARDQAVIKTKVGGLLSFAPREGTSLRRGDTLLRLDAAAYELALAEARVKRREAAFRKDEMLIQFGGEAGVDTSVSAQKLRAAYLRSGLDAALQAEERAAYELSLTTLVAPFSGVVADVKVLPHQEVNPGEPICTLVNMDDLEVSFSVLEEASARLRQGQMIKVYPTAFPEEVLNARIEGLNPLVGEDGLRRVRARLLGAPGTLGLSPGMTVEVSVPLPAKDYVSVPRTALVLRANREVVFVYDSLTQTAQWRYVETVMENETDAALSEGVKAGEAVIISGNLTLDHNSPVKLLAPTDTIR
jgi:RND family efflux transporter MFP subunit